VHLAHELQEPAPGQRAVAPLREHAIVLGRRQLVHDLAVHLVRAHARAPEVLQEAALLVRHPAGLRCVCDGHAAADRILACGGTARVARMDVTSAESVRAVFDELTSRRGRLDLLVQNAVREVPRSVAEATLDEWREVIESKLDGAFLCTQAALPLFARASRPSMIVVSSYEAERPRPLYPAYGVANAGLNAFVYVNGGTHLRRP
jgi:NAD(P)-dependent dehydrogenase (short-subunit alcohol dehydrogenase family)